MSKRTRWTVLVFVGWALGVVGVGAVHARQGSMAISIFNDEGTFAPELSRRDLEVFKRVLTLKDAEVAAMEDLYGAYVNALKEEGAEVRRFVAGAVEEAELMADQRLLKPANEKLTAWGKRSEELKTTFMADLKSLLTRDQEARWPIVERELRRIKGLGWGRLPGEQPDLINLTQELAGEGARSEELSALLERYSQDMDRALVAREQFLKDHTNSEFDGLVKSDPAEAKRLYDRATRTREGVVNVNDRYLREICAQLDAGKAQELQDRYFKACYPLLVKETRGERVIRAAAKLESLSSEQRAQINGIMAEYERERRTLLRRMAEVVRDEKMKGLPEALEKALAPPPLTPASPEEQWRNSWADGVPASHPMYELRRSRMALDRATRGKIEALLTASQRESLPDFAADAVVFHDDSPWGL